MRPIRFFGTQTNHTLRQKARQGSAGFCFSAMLWLAGAIWSNSHRPAADYAAFTVYQ
jgi:hypothetical protein